MKSMLGTLSLSVVITLSLVSCAQVRQVGDQFTGEGNGEIADIGNGQFDISAAGSISGNRKVTYEKWDRTAKTACNGGEYKIIKRDWQSAEYPGILGGIIECGKKKR